MIYNKLVKHIQKTSIFKTNSFNNISKSFCSFADKNVLITGGVEGIGQGTAQAFAKLGANVIVADIKDPITESSNIKYLKCDAGIPSDIEKVC